MATGRSQTRPERGCCLHVGAVLSADADDTLAFVPMQARVQCPADDRHATFAVLNYFGLIRRLR